MFTSLTFLRSKFPVLIVDHDLSAKNAGGRAMRDIIEGLTSRGLKVITANDFPDGAARILSHPEIGAIAMDQSTIAEIAADDMVRAVKRFRARYLAVGIFLDSSVDVLETLPVDLLARLSGFIYKLADTAAFIARRLEESLDTYLSTLLPPFFRELMKHTEKYRYS